MPVEIFQVDAFTDRPFSGNPAAVCLIDAPRNERWMQSVAREMNLSETAFVLPHSQGYALRWFTPTVEVDLCGHATLAAAHVLWETQQLNATAPARFHTRSGLLIAQQTEDWIELDFPAIPAEPAAAPAGLLESLGPAVMKHVREVGKSRFDYLVDVDLDLDAFRAVRPDFQALSRIPARGVIVTTSRTGDARFDFASRFFAPQSGIDEDPVTGSAHCTLAHWWTTRLNRNPLVGYQASPRGGIVRTHLREKRVVLSGQAVTIVRGTLLR